VTTPDLRIGDAERDAALAALGEHFAAGRLTREEYDERSEAVWTARTVTGLDVLFEDLPSAGRTSAGRSQGHGPTPARVLRRIAHVSFVPLMVGLVVLTAVTHLPFLLLGIALWVLIPRRHPWRHRQWGQAIGSRRPAGGSWA
jgi:hypothetical protein